MAVKATANQFGRSFAPAQGQRSFMHCNNVLDM